MDPFKRLPGSRRHPPGLEWALMKRLPAIWLIGCGLLFAVWLTAGWALPSPPTPDESRGLLLTEYRLIGAAILHSSLVLAVAIGCFIVRVMKGPAYVADAYPPKGREMHDRLY